jgi:hypothetical protein
MAILRSSLFVSAVLAASVGCSGSETDLSCEEALSVLAACTSTDQTECGDDSPAAQRVASGTCGGEVTGKADWFGNKVWGESCTWNWQCQQDSRHTCIRGTCYLRADVGNACDRRDSRDCETGLSCADDLSTPSSPGGLCQLTADPVRPALAAETPRANEEAEFQEHAMDIMGIQMRNAMLRRNGDDQIRRTFHAKHHACVAGRFEVLPGIGDLAVGPVFGQPQTFSAYVRFSNGTLTVGPDDSSPITGLAIKLVGVTGPKILEASRNALTQDFLLVNLAALPTVNANDFMELTKAQEKGGTALAHFMLTHPRVALRMLPLIGRKTPSVRTESYWAGGAYMHGNMAVKYSAKPCAGTPAATPTEGTNKLRTELAPHLASGGLCFDFFVQRQRDSVKQPIEDTAVLWDPAQTAPEKIGRLTVPPTVLGTAATNAMETKCDSLSFNPWNAAPQHKPLGHVNRSRKHAYEASRQMRGAAPEPTQIP